jgi:hypothetical protein
MTAWSRRWCALSVPGEGVGGRLRLARTRETRTTASPPSRGSWAAKRAKAVQILRQRCVYLALEPRACRGARASWMRQASVGGDREASEGDMRRLLPEKLATPMVVGESHREQLCRVFQAEVPVRQALRETAQHNNCLKIIGSRQEFRPPGRHPVQTPPTHLFRQWSLKLTGFFWVKLPLGSPRFSL